MGSRVSQTRMQTQVQQNGPYHCSRSSPLFMVLTVVHCPYHCSWSYHCSRSLLWTHLTFHNEKWASVCIYWGKSPESWFEHRGYGKMEGVGARGGRGHQQEEGHSRESEGGTPGEPPGLPRVLPDYSSSGLPTPLPPAPRWLCPMGLWTMTSLGKGQSISQHFGLLCFRNRTSILAPYSSAIALPLRVHIQD